MAANQQFCLRWNNHQRTLISVFDSLLESGTLVDCTLAAEGQYLKAHKVVLSACSPYLGVLLSSHHEKHPILILKDIKFQELKAMLDYMYRGEVNISQEQLCTFLKAAESLQIKGLTESAGLNPETKDFEERLVKRYDRKCMTTQQPQIPNHNARTRSPTSNTVNTTTEQSWNQKYSGTNFRSSSPPRIRDGSLSPTTRKRRKQQHPMPSVEDTGGGTSTSNIIENHQDSVDTFHDSVTNSVSSSNSNPVSLNMNNIKTEITEKANDNETRSTDSVNSNTTNSNKINELPVIPKTEPKFDDRHSDGDAAYEDSVEEMTIEDEEEEIDETDLSRPGPSHSDDSQNYGSSSYPLSSVNDGTSGQLDCQEPVTDPLAEQRFVCRLCGKLYQWKQSLTRHIREDRCDKGPQHACPRCGIIFKHTTRLNRHILFCPSVQMNATESNTITRVADSIISQSSTLSQVSNSSDSVLSPTFMSPTTTLS